MSDTCDFSLAGTCFYILQCNHLFDRGNMVDSKRDVTDFIYKWAIV